MFVMPSRLEQSKSSHVDRGEKRILSTQSTVSICRVIRAMRGGSQSQLVRCDDGRSYVAKFLGNPQGSRTLVNEVVSQRLIKYLGVATADISLLHLPPSAEGIENVFFQMGSRQVSPQAGLHFGSRCPVDPEKTAIFDVLPGKLLSRVTNLGDFATMFVLDKWLHHTDKRQAVYTRDLSVRGGVSFRAHFIDHGFTFGGSTWELGDAPLHGLAFSRFVYSMLDMRKLTRTAVELIEAIPADILQAAADGVPDSWFAPGDRALLTSLLIALDTRRERLGPLISRHLTALDL
jgi:hypothetical protein